MELYRRQQFEFLLHTAVERLAERLEQRHRGAAAALQSLRLGGSQSEIDDFVIAIFNDFLLDNIDGACFILQSLPQKRLGEPPSLAPDQTLEIFLVSMARQQFTKLVYAKTIEALEQHSGYEPVEVGASPR